MSLSSPNGGGLSPGALSPALSPAPHQPQTWSQLKNSVREERRCSPGYSLRQPANLAFRQKPLTDAPESRRRLYFLSSLTPGKESTLLYVDVAPGAASSAPLPWCPLIEAAFPTAAPPRVSKEEQLLWERKRCITWGISGYEQHPMTGKLLFPASGSIYTCVDRGVFGQGGQCPYEMKTVAGGTRLNAVMCPANDELVAYVGCNGGDVWVAHSSTGVENRLTHCKTDADSLADDPLTAGLPSYVTQEEFNRFVGFWWRPISEDNEYHILYEEVDESQVELLKFPESGSNGTAEGTEEFRFPRAGTANSRSILKLARFTLNEDDEVCGTRLLELKRPLDQAFPWMEYLSRAGWTPDGKFVWVQIHDRLQSRCELILYPLSAFVPVVNSVYGDEEDLMDSNNLDSSSTSSTGSSHAAATAHIINTQMSEQWISVTDIMVFLPPELVIARCPDASGDPNIVRFITSSEETGWRHLYLVAVKIMAEGECSVEANGSMAKILSRTALTSGQWSVVDKPVDIDYARGLVYFHGLKDSPLEKHLYVVSLNTPNKIKRLTSGGFSHTAVLSHDCELFATAYSSIQTLPCCQVFRIMHSDSTVDGVTIMPLGWVTEPKEIEKDYKYPELFSHNIKSGETIYGMVFKPLNYVRGKKYPVVLSVYGGPEVQLVTNTFKGVRQMRNHLLASHGYCVVCIDSRGSQGRGTAFEAHLRLRMGQVEMLDQTEVLEWLGSVTGYMDMSRVAIHGWSYGGYLSLMGLAQFPDLFKVCVAGAPVTTWQNYDTGYTERYMDLPVNNESGYAKGSILNRVNDFPSEPNRLLIVHGVMDENVHFHNHTMKLINQLVRAGKPYQLQIYPGERHSLRHLEASEHYETSLLWFLQSNL